MASADVSIGYQGTAGPSSFNKRANELYTFLETPTFPRFQVLAELGVSEPDEIAALVSAIDRLRALAPPAQTGAAPNARPEKSTAGVAVPMATHENLQASSRSGKHKKRQAQIRLCIYDAA